MKSLEPAPTYYKPSDSAKWLVQSLAFSIIMSYLEPENAINLQQLNKLMYERKMPQYFPTVFGKYIEPCIMV
jgi:hypothetical protein